MRSLLCFFLVVATERTTELHRAKAKLVAELIGGLGEVLELLGRERVDELLVDLGLELEPAVGAGAGAD